MTKVLSINTTDRVARVQAGITNIGITQAAAVTAIFYAPDPRARSPAPLGGNIATNSGGAHCLKYGVTTNNVLAVRIVMMNGEILDIGGDYLDAPGYDFLALIVGSEGQFGVVTEATVRLLKSPEGARPMLLGFDTSEAGGRLRRRHHRRRHRARGHRVHGQACDPGVREFRRRRLSARRRGAAHRRGRGLRGRDRHACSRGSARSPATITRAWPCTGARAPRRARDLEGPQGSLRRHRPAVGLYLHGRRDPAVQAAQGARRDRLDLPPATASTWPTSSMPATAICTRSSCTTRTTRPARARRAVRRRDPQALRQARRLPDRRAWRRHREAGADAGAVYRRRHRPTDAGEGRVRSRLAAQSCQGFSAGRTERQ